MRYLNRTRRGRFALFLLAVALAALSCSGGRMRYSRNTSPNDGPSVRVSPAHVADGDQAVVEWDIPGAEGVRVNGTGRLVSKGEGGSPDVYEPFPAKGSHVLIPSHSLDLPQITSFTAGGPGAAPTATPMPEAGRPGENLVAEVPYTITASMEDGSSKDFAAAVTVHRRATPEQAYNLQRAGLGVILDARDRRFFQVSDNIPGAVNIPLDELERRAGELPKDKTVIVSYVGGDDEVQAWTAVLTLAQAGREATVLKGGIEAWWQDITNKKRK